MIGACVERWLTLTPAREPRKPQLHELSHVTCPYRCGVVQPRRDPCGRRQGGAVDGLWLDQ